MQDGNVLCNIEVRLGSHYCMEKQCVTHDDCVFLTLLIQHAKGMDHVVLPTVTCPTLLCFPTLSQKRHDFRKKLLDIKYVF